MTGHVVSACRCRRFRGFDPLDLLDAPELFWSVYWR
jgi:hypothetical protein